MRVTNRIVGNRLCVDSSAHPAVHSVAMHYDARCRRQRMWKITCPFNDHPMINIHQVETCHRDRWMVISIDSTWMRRDAQRAALRGRRRRSATHTCHAPLPTNARLPPGLTSGRTMLVSLDLLPTYCLPIALRACRLPPPPTTTTTITTPPYHLPHCRTTTAAALFFW